MKTIDDALRWADTFDSPHSKHMSIVMLAAEVRRLRDEVNGLTGSADQASAWQEAVEDIASYNSVGIEGCDPAEAVARIKKASDDFVRVAVQRAERAEAAIAPMVETAQNQQEEIHRLWVTFSKASEILSLGPQEERRIPRPPSETFTQAISRLVAERDVALAALKEAQEQPAVAWMIHEYQGTGEKRLQFQPHIPSIRDAVTRPIVTALYASPVLPHAAVAYSGKHPSHVTRSSDSSSYDEKCVNCGATDISGGGWGDLAKPCHVPAAVAAPAVPTDEQIHAAYRKALGQSIRERDMPEIRKFAHALLQSTGEKK